MNVVKNDDVLGAVLGDLLGLLLKVDTQLLIAEAEYLISYHV